MTLSIFCLDVLVIQKKQPDKKDQINFKIYDVTIWLKNSCSTYIIQYLKVKTTRQSNIDYVIEFDKIFFSKNDAGNEAGRPVPDLFLFFFKKAFHEVKASGLRLSFNTFRHFSSFFESFQLPKTMFPSYQNRSIDLLCQSIGWLLYNENIERLRVKEY